MPKYSSVKSRDTTKKLLYLAVLFQIIYETKPKIAQFNELCRAMKNGWKTMIMDI